MKDLMKKIEDHAVAAEKVWGQAYGRFSKPIGAKNLKKGVEIGVAFGGHSESLLNKTKIQHLYGIDPYKQIKGYDDPMNLPQREFNTLFKFVIKRMSKYGRRYTHLRMTSAKASRLVHEDLDFAYIDADHSYEGVWEDLLIWFRKIRIGGIIGGHDYGHTSFPGVKQAIDEFFRRFDWLIHEEGEGVWWVDKKSIPISFIMPAYNAEKTITDSLKSIIETNLDTDDEIVIVDDKSTDNTARLLKELASTNHQVRIISHKTNRGGGAARNTAVKNAKNPLIFCLDSDNLLAPGSVPKLRDFLVNSGADVASFESLKYFKVDTSQITHSWKFRDQNASLAGAFSTFKFPGASGNYLFTKESWQRAGHYPESAAALDAWGFGLRQVATGSKMKVMPSSFYYHRYGHDSYWIREARTGKVSEKALQLLSPFLDLLEQEDVAYIKSEESRGSWFDNIEKRPIRLRGLKGKSSKNIINMFRKGGTR